MHWRDILWHSETHIDVAGHYLFGVHTFDHQVKLQLIRVVFLNIGIDSERLIEVSCYSVVHHCELTIGRVDLQSPVYIEFIGVHTFMEIAIIYFDLWTHRCIFSYFQVVIQSQFQLRVPMQIALHLNTAWDSWIDHISTCIEHHVYFFINIHKDLVLSVLLFGIHWLLSLSWGNSILVEKVGFELLTI